MSLIRKHGAVLQAWACLDLVTLGIRGVHIDVLKVCVLLAYLLTYLHLKSTRVIKLRMIATHTSLYDITLPDKTTNLPTLLPKLPNLPFSRAQVLR